MTIRARSEAGDGTLEIRRVVTRASPVHESLSRLVAVSSVVERPEA